MRLAYLILACLIACYAPVSQASDDIHALAINFFSPLPSFMPDSEDDTAEQIALGKALYFETALSANHSQSCNSCHDLTTSGADPRSTSPGALGIPGKRNSPTTWNAGLQFRQFWDGRASDLKEQAAKPLLNPDEMALASESQAVQRLTEAGYATQFESAYPNSETPLSFNHITHALAAFQRTLISKDRFDDYLRGDESALTAQEKRGLKRFIVIGCNGCHNGPLLGGQEFMKLGIAHPYPNPEDEGRAGVTGKRSDRFYFKVPPLRNVGQTAPYFHDGAGPTLPRAVFDTAWHQLGIRLNDDDIADITAFLHTLDNQRQLQGLPSQ